MEWCKIMANHKSDEPRTYIRIGITKAKEITDAARKAGVSIPEYLKNKKFVDENES